MKNERKKGISLIVLVITIIVIIILAAAVILTVNNNNPMSNANRARYESDRANVQNALTTAVGKIMGDKLCKLTVSKQDDISSGILYELTGANDGIVGGKLGWETLAADAPSGYEKTTNLGMKMPIYSTTTKWGIDAAGNVILTVGDEVYGPNASENEENLVANIPSLTGFNAEVTYYTKWNGTTEATSIKISGTEPTDWYDYSAGVAKWANIKTTGNGNDAYWVWIPRYAYQVPEKSSTAPADGIQIKFLTGTSNVPIGETEAITNTTPTPGTWVVHPAFQFGDKALTGIWVAKYEASSSNPSATNGGDNVTDLQVRVVPNVTSWRAIQVSNIFTVCRNLETAGNTLGLTSTGLQANGNFTITNNVNSHMMKSTEWGAVAYLSRSKYGKNAPVWINNSSTNITGNAGDSQDASSASGITNAYDSSHGQQASTTGNIYGVYDMSGGAWEYVSGYNNSGGSYASNILSADSKYKDVYPNNYSDGIYGDGGYETSIAGTGNTAWDGDYSSFPSTSYSFVLRGGFYGNDTGAGVFAVHASNGAGYYGYGFRPVVCNP